MNGEADNSRLVSMHVYMHLAFKELTKGNRRMPRRKNRRHLFDRRKGSFTSIKEVSSIFPS